MKLLLFLILTPTLLFSQVRHVEVTNKYINKVKKEWYKSRENKKENKEDFFRSLYEESEVLELVVVPDIYLNIHDSNLVKIEFMQDSAHFYHYYKKFQPSITDFKKNYSIGLLLDYMTDKHHVAFWTKRIYKDGSIKLTHYKMHLDLAILYFAEKHECIVDIKDDTSYDYDDSDFDW